MNRVTTCVIPAAGLGTRWLPMSQYIPKEMLPLGNRPAIDWVIAECLDSGIQDLVIVTNKNKGVIERYVSDLQKTRDFKVRYVYQEEQRGLVHALVLVEKEIQNDLFGVILPDMPSKSTEPVLGQLIRQIEKHDSAIAYASLAIYPDQNELCYSGCLTSVEGNGMRVLSGFTFDVHPGQPSLSGRLVLNRRIFGTMNRMLQEKNGELKDFEVFKYIIEMGGLVLGIDIEGHVYDTGTPQGLYKANADFLS